MHILQYVHCPYQWKMELSLDIYAKLQNYAQNNTYFMQPVLISLAKKKVKMPKK